MKCTDVIPWLRLLTCALVAIYLAIWVKVIEARMDGLEKRQQSTEDSRALLRSHFETHRKYETLTN